MTKKPFIHNEKGFFVELIPCFGHGLPPSRLALCPLSATCRVCKKSPAGLWESAGLFKVFNKDYSSSKPATSPQLLVST